MGETGRLIAPEIEMRVREAEAKAARSAHALLDNTKKLSVANKDTLLQLVGDDTLPGIIPQLRDEMAELAETVSQLTKTVATLAAQVAASAPPAGIKPALIKHGTTGVALGGTGGVIWIAAEFIRHFIGG